MDRNSNEFQAFMRVHAGLPRQGPGSKETTARALKLLPPLPQGARIYDLGCGSGHSALVLAHLLQQKVVAVDLGQNFLQELETNAAALSLSQLIEPRCADMIALEDAANSIDLIWAEGSIYCAGFDKALSVWRSQLTKDGLVACTELSWLTDEPSTEPGQFWQAAYPGARSVAQNIIAAEGLGYACLNHFVLPISSWWDEYYDPLLRNIERFKSAAERDNFLAQAIAASTAEVELFRRFSSEYGYVFYLLQKSDITIRAAQDKDAFEIAQVFRKSFQTALPTLPTLHTEEEDRQYFSQKVLPKNTVYVACDAENRKVGFIAFDDHLIHHLYVIPGLMGRGIGSRFLNIAKARGQKLRLWTFQRNEIAKRFYLRHGFIVVKETDGADNEENEDDVLFEWPGDDANAPGNAPSPLSQSSTTGFGSSS